MNDDTNLTGTEAIDVPPSVEADAPAWLGRFEADRRTAFAQLRRGDLACYAGAYLAFFEGRPVGSSVRFDLAQNRAAQQYDVPPESIFVMWIEPKEAKPAAVPNPTPATNGEVGTSRWKVQPIPPEEWPALDRYAEDMDAAYESMGRGELDQYDGRWVAFFNKQFAGVDDDLAALCDRVAAEHGISAGLVSTLYVETLWTNLKRRYF